MRICIILLSAVCLLSGATIRGIVVENQTGHPLARTLVALEPVAGTAGGRLSVRTNGFGSFQFPPLPVGVYVITASRMGYASVQYGQKHWRSSGVPVVVSENDSAPLTIRLPRFGSITGTVVDENDVGLPEYDVIAYRNTRPPQMVTRAKTDDRGIYRIYGLKPGTYLVRSAGKQYDDAEYIPTFSKETQLVEQAYSVDVDLDEQVDRVDIRPAGGNLYTLKVDVKTVPERPIETLPVTITLASGTGRETVQANSYDFRGLAPGQYELFAQAPIERYPGIQGHYEKVNIGQNKQIRIVLHQIPTVAFVFEGASVPAESIQLLGRRKDLAGESAAEVLKLINGRIQLAPGPWEFAITPTPGFYVSAFSGPGYQRPADMRADGWNEVEVGSFLANVRFVLSSSPGAVHGTVKSVGEPVAGAPVFLEAAGLEPRRRVTDTFATLTDMRGNYQFKGLAPGNYRVMSSFEYQVPDAQIISRAGAKGVKVDEGRETQQDLDLYFIP